MTTLAHLLRRTAVVLLAGALVLAASGPAGAGVPEGWETPDPVDPTQALLLLGGVPLLLILVITLLVMAPGRRGGAPVAAEDHWFGGPRQGTAELPPATGDDQATGGTSARW
ncbi:hypothetical protein [Nocardioides sp.]|uniref:hypothetical protein n=1 Tax=Nocardioides sp. TaxID=35761 RepID=UPI0025EEBA5A|nr:hypothetical protein [Nocardioides sp.]